jgi:ABC-2 type transport system ATP-binding protein
MTQHRAAAVTAATQASPTGAAWAIEAVGLVKTYAAGRRRPPVRALDGLTLSVRTGEVFGLLGPNGAGKSTTVRILSTLSRPDSGEARVAGHDVLADPSAVRHAIGLVSQKPSAAPLMTGRESLEMAARIQGLGREEARRRSDELLERFGLAEAADRLTKTYSGGMNRKLDVAIGLVNRPAVLFLDEPTTGLDPEARAEMWAEIARMASVDRMTVLLTTHYLDEADHLSDRLAIVDHGRVVAQGSPDELKSELRGDSLVFELPDPASGSLAAQRLSQMELLVDIVHEGRTVRARADRGASVIPTALAVLEQGGVAVTSATVARPSLDDVYLRHAGRAFEEVAS